MSQADQNNQRRADRAALVIALGLALFGAVLLWDSARLADLGGYSGVGPASMPRIIGLALLGLAIWTAAEAWRGDFPERPEQHAGPVLWLVGGLVAQLLLLNVAGFSIATGLLFGLTARGFGKRNLALTVGIGIVLSFFVWAVFSQLLSLHLPAGPLERVFFPKG